MFIKARVAQIDECEDDKWSEHECEHTSKHQFLEVQTSVHVPSHVAVKSGRGSKQKSTVLSVLIHVR